MRLAIALAASAAALALAAPAQAGERPLYGIAPQGDGSVSEGDLDLMRDGGVDAVRLIFHWGSVEPERGRFDWRATDELVRRAARRGLRVMPFVYGSTRWSAALDGHDCEGARAGCSTLAPASDATRSAFAGFTRAAVARYGPGGEFWREPGPCELPAEVPVACPPREPPCRCEDPLPVRVWQVWNEQNSDEFFAPEVDVESYAALLAASASAIRAEDPRAEVVTGGIWGPDSLRRRAGRPPVTPASTYLKRLYRVPEAAESFDAVGLHPYAARPAGVRDQMRGARRVMRRAGDRESEVWVTEIGWASAGQGGPQVKDLAGQARMLRRSFKLLERRRRAFRLRGVFWYTWRDGGAGSSICSWCAHAGLRFADGAPKPAWKTFTHFTGGRR